MRCRRWPRSRWRQGLTLAHFTAQLENLRDVSLTLKLILINFGTHPRVKLGYVGDKVSLRLAERGKVSLS